MIGFDGDNGGNEGHRLFRSFEVTDWDMQADQFRKQSKDLKLFLDGNGKLDLYDMNLDSVGLDELLKDLGNELQQLKHAKDAFVVAIDMITFVEKKYKKLVEDVDPTATFSFRVFPSHDDGSYKTINTDNGNVRGWYKTYSFNVRVDVVSSKLLSVEGNGNSGGGWNNVVGTSRLNVPMIFHEKMEVETNVEYSLWWNYWCLDTWDCRNGWYVYVILCLRSCFFLL